MTDARRTSEVDVANKYMRLTQHIAFGHTNEARAQAERLMEVV